MSQSNAPMKYSLRSLMRFSLRDLFWLTVVVALGVAWWVDRWRLASDHQHKVEKLTNRIIAMENELDQLKTKWPVIKAEKLTLKNAPPGMILVPETPASPAPAPNPPKP